MPENNAVLFILDESTLFSRNHVCLNFVNFQRAPVLPSTILYSHAFRGQRDFKIRVMEIVILLLLSLSLALGKNKKDLVSAYSRRQALMRFQ